MKVQSKFRMLKVLSLYLLAMVTINSESIAQTNTIFKSIRITSMSHKDSINQFLGSFDATEIDFNSNKQSEYPFRIKKNNNWILASEVWNEDEDHFDDMGYPIQVFYGYKFYGKEGYSILFPDKGNYLTIAEKENKKYLFSIYECKIDQFWFDEIKSVYKISHNGSMFALFDDTTGYEYYYCSKIRRGDNWAIGVIDNKILQLSSFEYNEHCNLDSIIPNYDILDEFEHLVIDLNLAKKTNKLFVENPSIMRVIPHEGIFEVWKNDFVGFYSIDLAKKQPMEYEELKVVNLDYMNAIALKKNSSWSFYDPEDASLLFENQAKTIEELIILWLNR